MSETNNNSNNATATITGPEPSQISEARLAANRANAQKSTGATTPEGKAKIRFNAVKNNLTGQTILVRAEDAARYERHIADYYRQFQPLGPEECALVQSIAEIRWRLNRVPALRLSLLGQGQMLVSDEDPTMLSPSQSADLDMRAVWKFEKDLRNLDLQENRLARRREREMAELVRLQEARKAREAEALAEASQVLLLAKHRDQILHDIPGVGFDFSMDRLNSYFAALTPAIRQKMLDQALAKSGENAKTLEAAA